MMLPFLSGPSAGWGATNRSKSQDAPFSQGRVFQVSQGKGPRTGVLRSETFQRLASSFIPSGTGWSLPVQFLPTAYPASAAKSFSRPPEARFAVLRLARFLSIFILLWTFCDGEMTSAQSRETEAGQGESKQTTLETRDNAGQTSGQTNRSTGDSSREAASLLEDPFGDDSNWLLLRSVDAANRKLSHQLEGEPWNRAAVDACDLYVQLITAPGFTRHRSLQAKQRKLHSVLRRTLRELEKKRPAGSDQVETTANSGGPEGPLGQGHRTGSSHPPDRPSRRPSLEDWEAESRDWKFAYEMSPGPGQLLARSGGAVVGDGAGLIRLIQTTVTPGVWDVNGGTASIQYYQRVHALVVRAPWMTHQETERLVNGLRR